MKTYPWAKEGDSKAFAKTTHVVVVDDDGHWWGVFENIGTATRAARHIATKGDNGRLKVPMDHLTLVDARDWAPLNTVNRTGERAVAASFLHSRKLAKD